MDRWPAVQIDFEANRRLGSEIRRQWHDGHSADVVEVLAQHPQLRQHKSLVLELAYQDYRQRLDRGEAVDAGEFACRLPTLQRSLYQFIRIRQLLSLSSDTAEFDDFIPWPEPGQEFLGFTLVGEIGRGAFARVFLARERDLGHRPVVLKVAAHGTGEAEILGRLRHPNIVPVYSIHEDLESPLTAVCMPYLGRATVCDALDHAFSGSKPPVQASVFLDTLRSLHDATELPDISTVSPILRRGSYLDGVIFLAEQIAEALACAHASGVCHCDLKPSNILLALDGRPLLLDFNLSFQSGKDRSRLGGTIPYMAPEQLRLLVCDSTSCSLPADPRSDLFSLGAIVYELISGQLPFGPVRGAHSIEETADDLIERQANGPEPLRPRNIQVGRRLAETIEACLAWSPDGRPKSAAEVASVFHRELRLIPRGRRRVHRHRTRVVWAVLAALLLAVALTVFLCLRPPYYVRQFSRGLVYLEQAAYHEAIVCFDGAIRANPDCREALLGRGRAYAKLNNPRMALEDFRAAMARQPDGRTAACIGDCLSRLSYHEEALQYYSVATHMGFTSAGMLNNAGYCCLQRHRLEQAVKYLSSACERDPLLQPAHLNLAVVYLDRALPGGHVGQEASFHIEKAISLGPPSVNLFQIAAILSMSAAKDDPAAADRALRYLEKARLLGLGDQEMLSRPEYQSLRRHPQFKRLLEQAPGVKSDPPSSIVDSL